MLNGHSFLQYKFHREFGSVIIDRTMGNCTKAPEVPEYTYNAPNNNGQSGYASKALPQGVGIGQPPAVGVENVPPSRIPGSNLPPPSNLPMGYPTLSVGPASAMRGEPPNINDIRAANFMANALAPANLVSPATSPATVQRTDGMHTTGAPWKAGMANPGMHPS